MSAEILSHLFYVHDCISALNGITASRISSKQLTFVRIISNINIPAFTLLLH